MIFDFRLERGFDPGARTFVSARWEGSKLTSNSAVGKGAVGSIQGWVPSSRPRLNIECHSLGCIINCLSKFTSKLKLVNHERGDLTDPTLNPPTAPSRLRYSKICPPSQLDTYS